MRESLRALNLGWVLMMVEKLETPHHHITLQGTMTTLMLVCRLQDEPASFCLSTGGCYNELAVHQDDEMYHHDVNVNCHSRWLCVIWCITTMKCSCVDDHRRYFLRSIAIGMNHTYNHNDIVTTHLYCSVSMRWLIGRPYCCCGHKQHWFFNALQKWQHNYTYLAGTGRTIWYEPMWTKNAVRRQSNGGFGLERLLFM